MLYFLAVTDPANSHQRSVIDAQLPALVAAEGLFEHLSKRAGQYHVLATAGADLALQEFLQHLHGQVALGHAPHLGQELV